MKNLRKAFALVLVIAMAFSLVTIASAAKLADYSDAASVTQKEAVDVLTQAGVLAGANGAFSPKDNFTREQAAKVICYLMLGSKVADALKTTTSTFSDVAATRWSAAYIQYGVTAGVINGMGDGTFNPEGKVTGTQFAKMILTALGYGRNGEYVGPAWELNTLKDAVALEILDLDVDFTAPATREQVAQYALNALLLTSVVWDKNTGEYKDAANTTTSVKFFAKKLGLDSVDGMQSGVFGHEWFLNDNSIGFYASEKLIASDATGLTIAQMTDKYGTWAMFYKATLDENPEYYLNGEEISAATANAYAVRGAVVNFINTDKDTKAETVSIIEKSVAVATGAPTVSFGSVKIPGLANPATMDGKFNEAKVVYPAGIEADDYLLYYTDYETGITYVEKAQIVTGVATTSSEVFGVYSYNIGGTARKSSQLPGSIDGDDPAAFPYNGGIWTAMQDLFNVELEVVIDNGGNIIDVWASTNVASTSNYAVVLETAESTAVLSVSDVVATLLFTDGTTKNVTIGKVNNLTATHGDNAVSDAENLEGQFVTYTVTDAGKYNIKDATYGYSETNVNIDRAATFIPGYVGDSETVFLTPNLATTTITNDWVALKGIANAPDTTGATAQNLDIVQFTSTGTAKFVYVPVTGPLATPTLQNVAYVIYDGLFVNYTIVPAKDGEPQYYEYKAIVDGQTTTVKSLVKFQNTTTYAAEVGLKALTTDDDGYVTSYAAATGATVGIGTAKPSNGIVKLGGVAYTYNASTEVYFIDAFGGVTVKAVADIIRDTDDVVTAYLTQVTTDGDLLDAIYITVK